MPVAMYSRGKIPAAMSQKPSVARVRQAPYPASKPKPILPSPAKTETCVAYTITPTFEGVLLVPASAFNWNFSSGGKTNAQANLVLQPSALIPLLRPVKLVPAVAATTTPTTLKIATYPAQKLSTPCITECSHSASQESNLRIFPPSCSPAASPSDRVQPVQPAPLPSTAAFPWPRISVTRKRQSAATVESAEYYVDECKLVATARFRRNRLLMDEILSDVAVARMETPSEGAADPEVLEKLIEAAEADTRRMDDRFREKVGMITESSNVFLGKLKRFQQVNEFINSNEFQCATMEAEHNRLQNSMA